MDFNWSGKAPAEGINQINFSAIISGLIKAPLNGKYIFHISTDASFSLSINGKMIVDHFVSNRRSR